MARSLKVLYFAWVRERMGRAEEVIELPDHVLTVADLAGFLAARNEEGANAFANPDIVRAAVDRRHVVPQTALGQAIEIAFFPPMTGG
jgi:sulfur-carrier protein